ncbi:hypothetical protein KI387_037510, partial [Taxus chinensis]
SQESVPAEMEKTLKAIELNQKGDTTGALRLLNTRVDDIDKSVKRVESLVQHNHKVGSAEIPK